ncbi:hypothetical protein E2C01_100207 [Portunus trituberculatus]|uniref:Uncharacterized protein n=1 Tax=Portunus trituberculatus TaxID=210409 RepID=A0A5B7KCR1_PORTR|nr:hypothetical protein [Portunus trituberculatus]
MAHYAWNGADPLTRAGRATNQNNGMLPLKLTIAGCGGSGWVGLWVAWVPDALQYFMLSNFLRETSYRPLQANEYYCPGSLLAVPESVTREIRSLPTVSQTRDV